MSSRKIYFIGFIVACLLLLISIYLQMYDGFIPCPLCTLQRLSIGLLGILLLLGLVIYNKRIVFFIINSLVALTAIFGIFFAGRQAWLQLFATTDNSECGVSLNYMLQVLPWNEVVQKVLAGGAECTQRTWEFLSLSMPEWALLWFILFLLLSIYAGVKRG